MTLDRLLPSIQPQSFLEWTCTSSEQSLVEFYTILLDEHLQVALQMLKWEVSKTDQSNSMMFKSGDCAGQDDAEVHLHALQTTTAQYQLCEWEHCHVGKLHRYSEMSGSLDVPDYQTWPCTPFL
jgi:hypothetical protein